MPFIQDYYDAGGKDVQIETLQDRPILMQKVVEALCDITSENQSIAATVTHKVSAQHH